MRAASRRGTAAPWSRRVRAAPFAAAGICSRTTSFLLWLAGPRPRSVLPHQERWTLNNPEDQRRPAIVLRRSVADDLSDRRTIVKVQAAAQRGGPQLFGDRA